MRRRSGRSIVVAGAMVIVVAAGGTAWGLSQGSGAGYRTAVAGNATVSQTLAATGTVSPVSHADEAFQVAGTVAHVNVKDGQRVRAGQILAHLDRSVLRGQLRAAQSTLASARNRMSADQSGQSSQISQGSSPTFQASEPTPVTTSPPGGSDKGDSPSGSKLGRLQSAVRAAQQATDQALSQATTALQVANSACAAQTSTGPSAPDPAATDSPDPQPTASSPSTDDCTAAGAALLAQQQEVSRAQQQLADAEAALAKALTAMLDSANNGSQPATPSGGSNSSPTSPSNSGSTASAADIALDQASIDQAQASVATYRADLAEATLRATIAGRVAAVSIARGDQVSASSGTAAVAIVGSRQEQIAIDLSATEIRRVKIGMGARVVVDGSSKALTGRVVNINSAGIQSSTGSVSYPVTITLPSGTTAVSGAAAAVTVVVATVDDVLAVPTSAVHYSGTTAYVQVLRDGKQTRRTVKVGAVGAALTQINSGLTDGQQVVLADLDAAVPSSSTSFNRGGFGDPGGGGGGNFARRFSGGGGGSLPAPPSGASFG